MERRPENLLKPGVPSREVADADSESVPNPVLPGYHADPSVCRVGGIYYLITSTCEYLPGIPVYRSPDLVSWRQIGNVVDRDGQFDLTTTPSSLGLFAPTIRFHAGTFHVTGTQVGRGHFVVRAVHPAGPWSDPIWFTGLTDGPIGWDPSLCFDDGSALLTFSTGRTITGARVDLASGRPLGPVVPLWSGTGGDAPEGPHLYRRGRWWYLVLAEGGTAAGHAVTVARSENPFGPFEPHPGNPVLSHRGIDSPFQAVGHADLVESPDGSWSAVVLGTRPVGGHGYQLLGRETFLVPVRWVDVDDGPWPVFGRDGRVPARTGIRGTPMSLRYDDEFVADRLDPGWLALRTAEPAFARTGGGRLLLRPTGTTLDDPGTPALLARRVTALDLTVSATITLPAAGAGTGPPEVAAGLALRRDEKHHYELMVRPGEVSVSARIGDLAQTVARVPRSTAQVDLRVTLLPQADPGPISGSGVVEFAVRDPDTPDWIVLATLESRYLSTEVTGGFTGVVVGALATGPAGSPGAVITAWRSRPGGRVRLPDDRTTGQLSSWRP